MSNIEKQNENDSIDDNKKSEIKDYAEFEDMEMDDELLRGIYSYGFEKPSAIQQKSIMMEKTSIFKAFKPLLLKR